MQEFLDTHNLEVKSRTDARKERMDAATVWDLMQGAERILVAKGKRVETFSPTQDERDSILSGVMGRSGSLRAPTLKRGDIFLVGFNDTLYGTETPLA